MGEDGRSSTHGMFSISDSQLVGSQDTLFFSYHEVVTQIYCTEIKKI